jgi:cell division septation protein DedD
MTSILNLETRSIAEVESRECAVEDPELQPRSASTDYEIVLGRSQIASWLFVGVITVAICSSLAYLAGETIAAKNIAANSVAAIPATAAPSLAATADVPQASILIAPKEEPASAVANLKSAAPMFAEPETGKVYIQLGALERGMSMLLAEGLRSHGFDSFVAPGPNDKLFRVLIGPLADPAAFRQAMVTINALDLASFARRYEK